MISKNTISLFLIFLFSAGYSQERNSVDDFVLKDARDGKTYSLSNFAASKGILVIFTSTDCPYSLSYESRIKALAEKYTGLGISIMMINSNFGKSESAESLEAMKIQARQYRWPYLADATQDARSKFGARKNPEAFLLKPEGGKFIIIYQGAIDDNPQVEQDVHAAYLDNAIEQFLKTGKSNPAFVNPAGCIIKKG